MSHTVDITHSHNTSGIVAFHPIAFGLGMRACGCPKPRPPIKYGSVREEKEPRGNEILPDLDARRPDA
jgi:hypothetical protein